MPESEKPSSRLAIEDVAKFLFGQQSLGQPYPGYGSFLYEGRSACIVHNCGWQSPNVTGCNLKHIYLRLWGWHLSLDQNRSGCLGDLYDPCHHLHPLHVPQLLPGNRHAQGEDRQNNSTTNTGNTGLPWVCTKQLLLQVILTSQQEDKPAPSQPG